MRRVELRELKDGDKQFLPKKLQGLELSPGPKYTGYFEDGSVAFICGISEHFPGAGEAWLHMVDKNSIMAAMKIRDLMEYLDVKHEYKRIHATAADETNKRFLEWIGFVEEGYLKRIPPFWEDGYLMRYERGNRWA